MDAIKEVPLSAKARLEIASMVYSRWCNAFDALKAAEKETWESAGKFCPKDEWPQYHADRKQSALTDFSIASQLKNEMCKWSPLVLGE